MYVCMYVRVQGGKIRLTPDSYMYPSGPDKPGRIPGSSSLFTTSMATVSQCYNHTFGEHLLNWLVSPNMEVPVVNNEMVRVVAICFKSQLRHIQLVVEYTPLSVSCICSAIETELQLKHTREARWMFNKALQYVPIHAKLWTDVSVACMDNMHVTDRTYFPCSF